MSLRYCYYSTKKKLHGRWNINYSIEDLVYISVVSFRGHCTEAAWALDYYKKEEKSLIRGREGDKPFFPPMNIQLSPYSCDT